MRLRRAQLFAAASTARSAVVQRVEHDRIVGPAVRRLAAGQVRRLPPRTDGHPDGSVADLARPLRFPQRGRGALAVSRLPLVGTPEFRRLYDRARRAARVDVDVAGPVGPAGAEAIAVLVAAGAPVVVSASAASGLEPVLGAALAALLATGSGTGRQARELRSIATRRHAHDRLWRVDEPRPISVLLATRRPGDFAAAARQISDQVDCDVTVLAGLHGDGWPADDAELLAQLPAGSAIERHPAESSLGQILTSLTARAGTDLVTKWDDDDWYGADHLADLSRAYAYSGADVVGKGAEFVYLEGIDTTIRRFATGAESYVPTLAGGTLLTSRSWLEHIGGWPDVRAGVDRAMLDATRDAGGSTYRLHGFQYVLRRRADQPHTWQADHEHFAAMAATERRGLDLALAGIEPSP